jgi:hypothetical protein
MKAPARTPAAAGWGEKEHTLPQRAMRRGKQKRCAAPTGFAKNGYADQQFLKPT